MTATYTIQHVPGYSGTDHFGREIAARVTGVYPTLTAARKALFAARQEHQHGSHNPGRFDAVRSDGKRKTWI
jgi:hypothetical protein